MIIIFGVKVTTYSCNSFNYACTPCSMMFNDVIVYYIIVVKICDTFVGLKSVYPCIVSGIYIVSSFGSRNMIVIVMTYIYMYICSSYITSWQNDKKQAIHVHRYTMATYTHKHWHFYISLS